MDRQLYDECSTRDRERINTSFSDYQTAHWSPGSRCFPDMDIDIRVGQETKPMGRNPLCTRSFVGGPAFSRGMAFPVIESRLQQGELQACTAGDRPNVPLERTLPPLNPCFRKFLTHGARATVPWASLVGESARDIATRPCNERSG